MVRPLLTYGIASMAVMAAITPGHSQTPSTIYEVTPRAAIPSPPKPGTISVSLGGLFDYWLGGVSYSGQNYKGQKTANYLTSGFTRLWVGMDGQSSNGILYGASFQFRQNFGAPSVTATTTTPSPGQGNSTLYLRAGYGYVGTPYIGTFKFGGVAGPMMAFATGMFEGFNDAAWNGDVPNFITPNSMPLFPFQDNGIVYVTDKIAYFTPSIDGFDFGVAWEPSFVSLNNSTACSAGSYSTCDNLSSSNVATDAQKRRNLFDLGLRYRGNIGPVGIKLNAGYYASGVVSNTAVSTSGAAAQRFYGMNLGHGGVELTAGGVTVGGHFSAGNENGQWGLRPVGGVAAKFYIVGAQYQTGPVIVGASYFNNQNQGDYQDLKTEGQRAEWGLAVGGTYEVTPGFGIYFSYLYGQRKQSNYDFLAADVGPNNNAVKAQAAGLGVTMHW